MVTIKHTSRSRWSGTVEAGGGEFAIGRAGARMAFSLKSRMGEDPATNPEELIGAALAGCYSMSLANELANDGTPARFVDATATVHLVGGESGFDIPIVDLSVTATGLDLDEEQFAAVAARAKAACPVSRLLRAEVRLHATLAAS